MRNIELTTAHNIVFRYELASTLQRMLAFGIDLFIMGVYAVIAGMVFSGSIFLLYTFILLVISFYHLGFEILNRGQSPGKMLVKLRVVTLRGTTPTVTDYFMRWVFRMVDITLSFGTLAILFISGSLKNQRIGDLIAQTSVINLRNNKVVTLESINNLEKELEKYQFPNVEQFSDDDMLLLKNAIHRYQKHKNLNNKQILIKIGKAISEKLSLPKDTQITVDFLKQVLKEYIIKTR